MPSKQIDPVEFERLKRALYGDPENKVDGCLTRLERAETLCKTLQTRLDDLDEQRARERQSMRDRVNFLAIGLGLSLTSNIAQLIPFLQNVVRLLFSP